MRPPSTFQWLIGNPLVGALLSIGVFVGIIGTLTGHVAGILFFPFLIAGAVVARAAERVSAYTRWQREWNGMGGSGGGMRLPSVKALRILAAIIIWLIFAVYSLEAPADDPWMQTAAVLFWIGTAVMGFAAVARMLGGGAYRRQTKGELVVSVCLSRPLQSPTVQDAYCRLSSSHKSKAGTQL